MNNIKQLRVENRSKIHLVIEIKFQLPDVFSFLPVEKGGKKKMNA